MNISRGCSLVETRRTAAGGTPLGWRGFAAEPASANGTGSNRSLSSVTLDAIVPLGLAARVYGWADVTEGAVGAARELADEQGSLTAERREQLRAMLPDLVASTPRTALAASRFKRLIAKAGAGAADAFHDLLVDALSGAAKKAIWGPGA